MFSPIRRVEASPASPAQPSALQRDVESTRAALERAVDRADIRELKSRLRALRRQLKTQH